MATIAMTTSNSINVKAANDSVRFITYYKVILTFNCGICIRANRAFVSGVPRLTFAVNSCFEDKTREADLEKRRSSSSKADRFQKLFPTIFFGIFFLATQVLRTKTGSSLPDIFLLSAAAIATLLVANQRLPLQNVAGLVVIIAIFWWATLLIAKTSGIFIFSPRFRFHFLREYESGLLWVIGIINARGIAQLVLHRWRNCANYGLWLIALGSFLVAIEDSAARQNFVYFAEKFAFAAAIFVSATPWLLDKRRVERKPDFQPLFIILLIFLW